MSAEIYGLGILGFLKILKLFVSLSVLFYILTSKI